MRAEDLLTESPPPRPSPPRRPRLPTPSPEARWRRCARTLERLRARPRRGGVAAHPPGAAREEGHALRGSAHLAPPGGGPGAGAGQARLPPRLPALHQRGDAPAGGVQRGHPRLARPHLRAAAGERAHPGPLAPGAGSAGWRGSKHGEAQGLHEDRLPGRRCRQHLGRGQRHHRVRVAVAGARPRGGARHPPAGAHRPPPWHPRLPELRLRSFTEAARERFDFAFATWWLTWFDLWRLDSAVYGYLNQSLESRFHAEPHLKHLNRITYSLPLLFVTEARWLAEFIRTRAAGGTGALRAQRAEPRALPLCRGPRAAHGPAPGARGGPLGHRASRAWPRPSRCWRRPAPAWTSRWAGSRRAAAGRCPGGRQPRPGARAHPHRPRPRGVPALRRAPQAVARRGHVRPAAGDVLAGRHRHHLHRHRLRRVHGARRERAAGAAA